MVAFLTPREMFYDYQEHMNYEKDEYENRMIMFQIEATEKFSKETATFELIAPMQICISELYLEGCQFAKYIYEKMGLRTIHAYAILSNLNDFIQEYDEKEMNEPDYD